MILVLVLMVMNLRGMRESAKSLMITGLFSSLFRRCSCWDLVSFKF